MSEARDRLSLKWGTLKSWDFSHNETARALMSEYTKFGMSMSAMTRHDTPEQKEILCQIVDALDCEIYLDWDGVYISKEKAKQYIRDY